MTDRALRDSGRIPSYRFEDADTYRKRLKGEIMCAYDEDGNVIRCRNVGHFPVNVERRCQLPAAHVGPCRFFYDE